MFDALKEIRFRTILIVGILIWIVLAVIYFTLTPETEPELEVVPEEAPLIEQEELQESPGATSDSQPAQVEQPASVPPEGERPASAVDPSGPAASTQTGDSDFSIPRSGTFVVQAGAFSKSAGAQAQQKKLEGLGFDAKMERSSSPQGEVIRVYLGPFETRSQAEEIQQRLAGAEVDSFLRKVE